ncbi:outer membrane protein assembly factor BamD [Brachymonas denitrificans]|uniref:outer membrane protein assembly factor BamD n=1 Tax=Brachymonas denitrificans TaxID=28220 RepID=UPI00352D0C31
MQKTMRTGPLSRVYSPALLAGCMAVLLSACSAPPTLQEKTSSWSPNKIYSEARSESNSGGFEQAIPLYDVLEGRAAGTPLAQQAQLEKAYAQFQNGDIAEASATLDRFIRLNPSSPALDYAIYMKGVVNFNNKEGWLTFLSTQDLAERDMQAAKDSFEAFRELVTRFPDSRYAADARKRMTYIVNAMAKSEVAIASYYFKRGAYVAAINRAQSTISNYQGTPAQEEALAILMSSYDRLGLEQPRDDAQRVLAQNFPESRYLEKGYKAERKSFWKLW